MQAGTPAIVINVGGKRFHSTKSTLCKSPFFKAMFRDPKLGLESESNKSEAVIPFIDRDADAFKHVLSLLRDPMYPFPSGLEHELSFFGLESLPKISELKITNAQVGNNKYTLFSDIVKGPIEKAKVNKTMPVQLVPMSSPLPVHGCQTLNYHVEEISCVVTPQLVSDIKACGCPIESEAYTKIVCGFYTQIYVKDEASIKKITHEKLHEMWSTREQEGLCFSVVPVLKSLADNTCESILLVPGVRGHRFQ